MSGRRTYDPNSGKTTTLQPPFPRPDKDMSFLSSGWKVPGLASENAGASRFGATINATDKCSWAFKLDQARTLTTFCLYTNGGVAAPGCNIVIYSDLNGVPNDGAAAIGTLAVGAYADYGITTKTGAIALAANTLYHAVVERSAGTSFGVYGGTGHRMREDYSMVKTGGVWYPTNGEHPGWFMQFADGHKRGTPMLLVQATHGGDYDVSTEKIWSGGKMIGVSWLADCNQLVYGAKFEYSFQGAFQPFVLRGFAGADGSPLALLSESPAMAAAGIRVANWNTRIVAGQSCLGELNFGTAPMRVNAGQRAFIGLACATGSAANYIQIVRNSNLPSTGNIGNQSQIEKMFGYSANYSVGTVADPNASPWAEGCPWIEIERMLIA